MDTDNADQLKARGRKQAALIQDYQRTFGSEPGKRVLQDLFRRFGFKQTTAVVGDSHLTYFNEGQRAVVLWLIGQMKVNSNELLKRLEEMKGDE